MTSFQLGDFVAPNRVTLTEFVGPWPDGLENRADIAVLMVTFGATSKRSRCVAKGLAVAAEPSRVGALRERLDLRECMNTCARQPSSDPSAGALSGW